MCREQQYRSVLEQLVGRSCWGFAAGSGTGSVVSLQIGEKVPHKLQLTNRHISEDLRRFSGEFVILIECVWRLDSKSKIVTGAWDDNRRDGPMLKGLDRIVGRKIERIEIVEPGLDLNLWFENGLVLRVFCDQINEIDATDNYSVFTPALIYCVGERSGLRPEGRQYL